MQWLERRHVDKEANHFFFLLGLHSLAKCAACLRYSYSSVGSEALFANETASRPFAQLGPGNVLSDSSHLDTLLLQMKQRFAAAKQHTVFSRPQ
jgi:hypothetical protein